MGGVILGKGITRDTKVYRIIPYHRFLDLFQKKQNCLVRPKLWDDPFENLALNSPVDLMGEIASIGFKDDVFAQCWSLETASDAMWRIYSNKVDGIRIRSTVGKLLAGLANAKKKELPELSCFVGKVRYLTTKKLNYFAANQFLGGFDSGGQKLAETLLIKRKPFKHEREVRLIYFDPVGDSAAPDLHFYHFDAHKIIDQIMMHPQLNNIDAKTLKSRIKKDTGWTGQIKQSMMYRPPKGFVFKVGF